jgi:hypothetical protein
MFLLLLCLKRRSGTTIEVSMYAKDHHARDFIATISKMLPSDKPLRNAPFRDLEYFHYGPVVNADVSLTHSSVKMRVQPA